MEYWSSWICRKQVGSQVVVFSPVVCADMAFVRHATSSTAFPNLSADEWPKDAWPVLGVAVNAIKGNMHVCWALVQKQGSQQSGTQSDQRPEYVAYNLLDHVQQATRATIHTIESSKAPSKMDAGSYEWRQAFSENNGPMVSKENGNKFFPYIKVSPSQKGFKVNNEPLYCIFFCLDTADLPALVFRVQLCYNFGMNTAVRPMLLTPLSSSEYWTPLALSINATPDQVRPLLHFSEN
jgi:hypothetical protein